MYDNSSRGTTLPVDPYVCIVCLVCKGFSCKGKGFSSCRRNALRPLQNVSAYMEIVLEKLVLQRLSDQL